jgi:hypothetical protein
MQTKKILGRVGGRLAQVMAAVGLVTGLFVVGAPAASAACLSVQSQAEHTVQVQAQTSHVAVSPSSVTASSTTNSVQPRILTWTPYDGAAIGTYQKCLNRLNYLRSVRPDITHWDCQQFPQGGCGSSSYYWMVMVGTNY